MRSLNDRVCSKLLTRACSILHRRDAETVSSLRNHGRPQCPLLSPDARSRTPAGTHWLGSFYRVPLCEGKAHDVAGGTKETAPMIRTRAFVAAGVALAGIVGGGVVFAQAPASPPATTAAPAASAPTSTQPSAAARVETWTRKQWAAAKKEWARDKTKWADCRKQSSKQKLEGRKSWSFLYKCMTS
jgi:hypothetical protein